MGKKFDPKRIERFLANPPKRISPETVNARRNKIIRRSQPRDWLEELCEVQGWKCYYCHGNMRKKRDPQKPWLTATLEHLHPISRGGRNQRSNVAAACERCNLAKGSMTVEEFNASKALAAGEGEEK